MIVSKLKIERIRNGFSQEDLAKKIGVSRQTINLIEKNKYNPSLKICKGICKELKTTLDVIFGEE